MKKKAILLAILASLSTTAGAVAMCVNTASPDGAEIGLCRTDSLALCPVNSSTNQFSGTVGAAASCDAVLVPFLSQRQLDLRAAQARTDAWLLEAQQMCQAPAGQCVADRVAYMQAQWDLAQAAAAQAAADAAAAAAAAQANTIMTTTPDPVQIAASATTPAMTTATTLPRLPSSSSGAGYESAGTGYRGDGLSWEGRTKIATGNTFSRKELEAMGLKFRAKPVPVEVAQAQAEPAKRHCDEFFETRAGVEYWGSRDQKGNINNVCRKPARK